MAELPPSALPSAPAVPARGMDAARGGTEPVTTGSVARPAARPRAEGRPRRSRLRRGNDRSDGFVLVYASLMLSVMIGIGGIAVDVGNWYLHIWRLQRAADAAALTGSTYLPGDVTGAKAAASATLSKNAIDTSQVAATITQSAVHPSYLNVALTESVPSYFVQLLGVQSMTFTRDATAEYRPYVPMGSPSNVLGVEPSIFPTWEKSEVAGTQSQYWLNLDAVGSEKQDGDRWDAARCDYSPVNCTTSAPLPNGNTDYIPGGQPFVVRIDSGTTGTLVLQVFDPALVRVGGDCTASTLNGAYKYDPPGTNLYDMGGTNPVCTADDMNDLTKAPPTTTYSLWTPASTPGGSTQISTSTCKPITYAGFNGTIANKVNPASSSYDASFVGYFRKWVTVCQLDLSGSYPPGDYILRVQNDTATSGVTGANRFGIRAAIFKGGLLDTAATKGVSLFAQGRLVIYAKDETQGDVLFYIARVQSGAAGQSMHVSLYDVGDASGGASLQLLPPSDAKNGGTTMTNFTSCSYTGPSATQTTYQPTSSNCTITNITNSAYNGRLIDIKIDMPTTYTCDDASAYGCWTRLRVHYGAGSVHDTTSWQVSIDGNPVHLVIDSP